jgi:hypothetical protein
MGPKKAVAAKKPETEEEVEPSAPKKPMRRWLNGLQWECGLKDESFYKKDERRWFYVSHETGIFGNVRKSKREVGKVRTFAKFEHPAAFLAYMGYSGKDTTTKQDWINTKKKIVPIYKGEYVRDSKKSKMKKDDIQYEWAEVEVVSVYNRLDKAVIEEQDLNFFEVIKGCNRQKPHFDVDISLDDILKNLDLIQTGVYFDWIEEGKKKSPDYTDLLSDLGDAVLEHVLEAIREAFETILWTSREVSQCHRNMVYKVIEVETGKEKIVKGETEKVKEDRMMLQLDPRRDIRVYSSHGPVKRSFHIVLPKYCHKDNIEAKLFYERVIGCMRGLYTKFVDLAVYTRTQQFRLLGSQKAGSSRPKMLMTTIPWDGRGIKVFKRHHYLDEFEDSLVSWAHDADLIPELRVDVKTYDAKGKEIPGFTWECVGNLEDLIAKYFKDSELFDIRDIRGSIVETTRLKPSYCTMCERTHHGENPYITISERGDAYFYCGRYSTIDDEGVSRPLMNIRLGSIKLTVTKTPGKKDTVSYNTDTKSKSNVFDHEYDEDGTMYHVNGRLDDDY